MGEVELISAGAFSPSSIEQSLIKGKDGGTEGRGDGATGRRRERQGAREKMSSLFRPVAPSPCRLVALSLSWNDRQHDRRWALGVVKDRLIRLDHLGRSKRWHARVEVAIEA